jgi:hypothetical protein
VLQLVRTEERVSADTVNCLRTLLERAEAGEVIGVAYAAMYRQREYRVHTCGEMEKNPTFARGAVAALEDKVSRRQWGS